MNPDAIPIIKTEPVKSWVTRQELEDAIQITKTDDDGYPLEARVVYVWHEVGYNDPLPQSVIDEGERLEYGILCDAVISPQNNS